MTRKPIYFTRKHNEFLAAFFSTGSPCDWGARPPAPLPCRVVAYKSHHMIADWKCIFSRTDPLSITLTFGSPWGAFPIEFDIRVTETHFSPHRIAFIKFYSDGLALIRRTIHTGERERFLPRFFHRKPTNHQSPMMTFPSRTKNCQNSRCEVMTLKTVDAVLVGISTVRIMRPGRSHGYPYGYPCE